MSKPQRDKKIEVPDHILRRLLTESEIRMLKNRWQIIQYLEEGLSIRAIAERASVGTDTVVRVSKMIQKSPLGKNLTKQQNNKQFKTKTPWIFGKNS